MIFVRFKPSKIECIFQYFLSFEPLFSFKAARAYFQYLQNDNLQIRNWFSEVSAAEAIYAAANSFPDKNADISLRIFSDSSTAIETKIKRLAPSGLFL